MLVEVYAFGVLIGATLGAFVAAFRTRALYDQLLAEYLRLHDAHIALLKFHASQLRPLHDVETRTRCTEYRPDHNGECLNCDEPASEHDEHDVH